MSLLTLGGILLVFMSKIDYFVLTQEHQCTFKHYLCNPNITNSCCDPKDECKPTWPDNYFRCVGDRILWGLGKFCELDEDCGEIRHAKCSKAHACVCRMNSVRVDPWNCAPILGEFCWKNESCAIKNAVCTNNTCQCTAKYYPRSTDKCIPYILGTSCIEDDKLCDQVKFATCSTDKICTCSFNTTAVGLTHCAPIVGGFCWGIHECTTPNSICLNNRCECTRNTEYNPEHGCVPVPFNAIITNAICSQANKCMCYRMNLNEFSVCTQIDNIHCATNNNCLIANTICLNNFCQCKPGFKYRSNFCAAGLVVEHLYEACTYDSDCDQINHAVCSLKKVCVCADNYFGWNMTSCRPLLGGLCSNNDDCLTTGSLCIENKCQCTSDLMRQPKHSCAIPYLGMLCEEDSDCERILHSQCYGNNRCDCKPNYEEYNMTACAPLLGEDCSEDKLCAPTHSSCVNDTCLCDYGFVRYDDSECAPHHIGMRCGKDDDCRLLVDSKCIDGLCYCAINYAPLNSAACAPVLGQNCRTSQQCADPNSYCRYNTCQCRLDYVKTVENRCVPYTAYFHKSCNADYDCRNIKYSFCSANKKCFCEPNYIALGDRRCLALIGEHCDTDDECISHNTVCIDNKCQCHGKLSASSKYQCDLISLGVTCRNNDDCSRAIKNSECSVENKCDCIETHYAINKFECAPLLYGNCSSNEECKFNSSVCIGNKCMCMLDSRAVSENQCKPVDYMYTCDNELDCGDPWHYRCDPDKRCRCNTNNYSINKSTCLPLLKGYCWTDSQCIIVNSACIDFHCQCRSNFVAVSNNLCIPEANTTRFFF